MDVSPRPAQLLRGPHAGLSRTYRIAANHRAPGRTGRERSESKGSSAAPGAAPGRWSRRLSFSTAGGTRRPGVGPDPGRTYGVTARGTTCTAVPGGGHGCDDSWRAWRCSGANRLDLRAAGDGRVPDPR